MDYEKFGKDPPHSGICLQSSTEKYVRYQTKQVGRKFIEEYQMQRSCIVSTYETYQTSQRIYLNILRNQTKI